MLATLATNVLLRHRLVDQIAFAVRAPIAVILAPAGHGKSTALQQYLASCSEPAILFAARPGRLLSPPAQRFKPDQFYLFEKGFHRSVVAHHAEISVVTAQDLTQPDLLLAHWNM